MNSLAYVSLRLLVLVLFWGLLPDAVPIYVGFCFMDSLEQQKPYWGLLGTLALMLHWPGLGVEFWLGFYGFGLCWGFWAWCLFCEEKHQEKRRAYIKWGEEQIELGIALTHAAWVATEQGLHYAKPPQVQEHFEKLVTWVVCWPYDVLFRLVETFAASFNNASKRIWSQLP